jgi:Zn-finger nucleic acid-binding protein
MPLSACPVCRSERVILVVSRKRRAFCARCGTKWIQEGAKQRQIEPRRVDQFTQTPGNGRNSR